MQEPVGHAFISYVREDSHHVDALQLVLEAAGVRVWRDKDDLWPGDDWRMMIGRAITGSALVFIACFSSQSTARTKTYQNEELTLAAEQFRLRPPDARWLIPVRFDDCQVPALSLGAGRTLDSIQRTDLFGDDRVAQMKRLVTTVQRLLGPLPPGQAASEEVADPAPSVVSGLPGIPAAGGRPAVAGLLPGAAGLARSPKATGYVERIGEVARQLAAAGFPPDELVSEGARQTRGLLGGAKWVRDPARDLYGWSVGEYVWRVPDNSPRSDGGTIRKSARTFVTADGRLVKEGGHSYDVDEPLPQYVPEAADTGMDSPFGGGVYPEFWEKILAKMLEMAHRHGVDVH